jgi:hypothetical protein
MRKRTVVLGLRVFEGFEFGGDDNNDVDDDYDDSNNYVCDMQLYVSNYQGYDKPSTKFMLLSR